MSVMYVMALAFITELIGENKVCVNHCSSASCLAYFVEGSEGLNGVNATSDKGQKILLTADKTGKNYRPATKKF